MATYPRRVLAEGDGGLTYLSSLLESFCFFKGALDTLEYALLTAGVGKGVCLDVAGIHQPRHNMQDCNCDIEHV